LSEDILASFKQRIKENEELVSDVQKTLDNFRKDHQEMAAVINSDANALRKDLAHGEKERLNTYHGLMTGIHRTISSIQKEVSAIQNSTFNMIKEFKIDRTEMAKELNSFFAKGKADRMQNEKSRMKEFDFLMKDINREIKSINEEVLNVFKNTNDMLDKFEKEHMEMSVELRAELSKNLTERVEYTKSLLNGFQKRVSEISKQNQKMAQKLRKDLANGESERLDDYGNILKGIHLAIKGIRKEVKEIQKATNGMIDDFSSDRGQASSAWNKMQDSIANLREEGVTAFPKPVIHKIEKKEVKKEILIAMKETQTNKQPAFSSFPEEPKSLEQKVMDYIVKHPNGVKISEMEEPLGETRMKLGFTAKTLLDAGKVQRIDKVYFPLM